MEILRRGRGDDTSGEVRCRSHKIMSAAVEYYIIIMHNLSWGHHGPVDQWHEHKQLRNPKKGSAFPKSTGTFIKRLLNTLLSSIRRNCNAGRDVLRVFDPEMVGYQWR